MGKGSLVKNGRLKCYVWSAKITLKESLTVSINAGSEKVHETKNMMNHLQIYKSCEHLFDLCILSYNIDKWNLEFTCQILIVIKLSEARL